MRFTVEGKHYQPRAGANLQQFWIAEGGPRNGIASSLPGITPPAELSHRTGGRYVTTGETNEKNQHVYRWEPTP